MRQIEPFFDDCQIQFEGFDPSDFIRSFLGDKIDSIYEEAPYKSRLKAFFRKKEQVFEGVVRISSAVGSFLATASDDQIKNVVHKLEAQLREQLNSWKSQRFNNQFKEVEYDTNHVA